MSVTGTGTSSRSSAPGGTVVATRLALATAWATGPDGALATAAAEAAGAAGDPGLIVASFDALQAAAVAEGRTEEALRHDRERLHLAAKLDVTDPHHAPEIDDATSSACLAAVAEGNLPTARAVAAFTLDNDLLETHPFLTLSKTIPAFVLGGELDETARLADDMWDAWLVLAELPDAERLLERATAECASHPWAAACLARAAGRLRADADALAARFSG